MLNEKVRGGEGAREEGRKEGKREEEKKEGSASKSNSGPF